MDCLVRKGILCQGVRSHLNRQARIRETHRMRFTIGRMMLVVVCLGIGCYYLRFVSDPAFGYGTIYSAHYSEMGFADHVAMTAIYTWLLKMTGGDETRASAVAVSIAVIGAVVLGVGLYFAMTTFLMRLSSIKDRCPRCGRRTLIVCWFDDNDDEGVEYVFSRCISCAARYRQRLWRRLGRRVGRQVRYNVRRHGGGGSG